MFTPETGKVTYKCKGDGGAFMEIAAFGGVVKFNRRGSKAVVAGHVAELQDCVVITPREDGYAEARKAAAGAAIAFKEEQAAMLQREIRELGGRGGSCCSGSGGSQ